MQALYLSGIADLCWQALSYNGRPFWPDRFRPAVLTTEVPMSPNETCRNG